MRSTDLLGAPDAPNPTAQTSSGAAEVSAPSDTARKIGDGPAAPPKPPPSSREPRYPLRGPYNDDEFGFFGSTRPGPPAPKLTLKERLDKDPQGIVVSRYGELIVERLEGRSRASKISSRSPLPSGKDIAALQGRNRQLPIFARVESATLGTTVDYAFILPPNFKPSRKPPYAIETVLPPLSGGSLTTLVRETISAKPNPDAIRIIPDPAPEGAVVRSQAFLQRLVEGEILGRIPEGYNLTLDGYRVRALPGEEANLVKLASIHVSLEGKWTHTIPTVGESPSCQAAKGTEIIPKALQKQPADHGSFFMPVIRSDALSKDVRAGIYLPPGYDPASRDRYPVLFLLPGRKNPLASWIVAGGAIAKLDRMMSGDAQKMIVVIADSNDSYFVNSPPKEGGFGSKTVTRRDYQDHLMKELITYATETLNGDDARLCLGGLSRGAFGAMVAAAQHPGVFKAVASYSGLVGLDRYAGKEPDSPDAVDRSGPSPARLALAGAFSGTEAPRIHLEVGVDDNHVAEDATQLASILKGAGAEVDYQHLRPSRGSASHDWELWEGRFEEWIAWHQSTFGKAGHPSAPYDAVDVSSEMLSTFAAAQEAKWQSQEELVDRMDATGRAISDGARELSGLSKAKIPSWISRIELANLKALPDRGQTCVERARQVLGRRGREPFMENHVEAIRREEIELADLAKRVSSLKTQIAFWGSLAPARQEEFQELFVELPEGREALIGLLGTRPELFAEEDSVNHKRFATQIADHIRGGFVKSEDTKGFVGFLRRLAERTWTYREGGYSHSNCAAMMFPLNHPGVLLDMVEAAKSGADYPLFTGWEGFEDVGAKVLAPRPELKAAWRAESMPPYEEGFIRSLKDSIAPKPGNNPPEWKAGRCDPIAFALSRLSGHDYRYGYAYNIVTGADLVEAMESQTGEGWIAMADVGLKFASGRDFTSHFPVFYDYDPKSRTVAMQDFSNTSGERLPIDGLKLDKPAIYYRNVPEMDKFMTPEHQKTAPASGFGDYRWNENADLLNDFGATARISEKGSRTTPQFSTSLMQQLAVWNGREVGIRIHYRVIGSDQIRRISAIVKASDFRFPGEGDFEFGGRKVWAMDMVKVEFQDTDIARPKEPVYDELPPFRSVVKTIVRDKSQYSSEDFRREVRKALEPFGSGDVAVRVHMTAGPQWKGGVTVAEIVSAKLLGDQLQDVHFRLHGTQLYGLDCDRIELTHPAEAKKTDAPPAETSVGAAAETFVLKRGSPSYRGRQFDEIADAARKYGDAEISVRIHHLKPTVGDPTNHVVSGVVKASHFAREITHGGILFGGQLYGNLCDKVEIAPLGTGTDTVKRTSAIEDD